MRDANEIAREIVDRLWHPPTFASTTPRRELFVDEIAAALKKVEAETIERCARVARRFADRTGSEDAANLALDIEDAIMAHKSVCPLPSAPRTEGEYPPEQPA